MEKTGVLALQGDFREHAQILGSVGATAIEGEPLLSLMDVTVRRNAYGPQVDSFETDVDVEGIDHPVRGVFIRAPWIEDVGSDVHVLSEYEGRPVILQQGNLLASS